MKPVNRLCSIAMMLGALTLMVPQSSHAQVGTTFSYQGYVLEADEPIDGERCFEFRLFDAPTNGSRIGFGVTPCNVPVKNGRFTVDLDFGAEAFGSSPRWLEVSVEGTTLSPRQRVSPAPLAMFAQKSAQAQTAVTAQSSADGVPAGFSILGKNSTPPPGYEWTGEALGDGAAIQWSTATPMPLGGVAFPKGDAINGKWYMCGANLLYEFDPATNSWTQKANMPISRGDAAAVAAQGRLFVFGGNSQEGISRKVHSYDQGGNSWYTAHTDMPVGLVNHAAVATAVRIHVLGGNSASELTNSHLIFNPYFNTWITGAPLPARIQNHVAVLLDDKIHVLGGTEPGGPVNSHYVYNTNNSRWTTAAPLPTAAFHLAAVVKGKNIHVIEGLPSNAPTTAYYIYDSTTDTWKTSFPVPTPRSPVRAAILNDTLYVLSGLGADKAYSLSLKPAYYVHVKK